MVGDPTRRANARRIHLVEFLVANQVVRVEDLGAGNHGREQVRSDAGEAGSTPVIEASRSGACWGRA
ncbi:MAG: hypothetical protein R2716_02255 [Microthrixaceae bacterium]